MKPRFTERFALFGALTLIWMVVIFLLSAQTGEDSSGLSERLLTFLCGLFRYSPSAGARNLLGLIVRKTAHLTEFGVLALLWLGVFLSGYGRKGWTYPAAFGASSLYAATDELHQLFVSERAGQATDWMIDSAGALVFLFAGWLVIRLSHKTNSNRQTEKDDEKWQS